MTTSATTPRCVLLALVLMIGGPVMARDTLGVFDGWGTFSDPRPRRCYAIAEPERRASGAWRPFAAIAAWPRRGVRAQINIRLRQAKQPGAAVTLTVGNRRFALVAGGADAWAPNAAVDAAIVATIRQSDAMRIETRAKDGSLLSDRYRLQGAATAIDAATIACARG